MSPSTLFRLSGLAGVLGGACVAVAWLLPQSQVAAIINLASLLFAPFLLTGLYLRQREQSGQLGGVGYAVYVLGVLLVGGLAYSIAFVFPSLSDTQQQQLFAGATGSAFMVSGLSLLAGAILFSIATLRARVFPPIAVVLQLIGAVPLSLVPLMPPIVVSIGAVLFGVGVIWLGYALWSSLSEGRIAEARSVAG